MFLVFTHKIYDTEIFQYLFELIYLVDITVKLFQNIFFTQDAYCLANNRESRRHI